MADELFGFTDDELSNSDFARRRTAQETEQTQFLLECLDESLSQTRLTKDELTFYQTHPVEYFEDILFITPTNDQVILLNDIANGVRRILVLSGRGTGKSLTQAGVQLWGTTCFPNTHGRVLAGSFEQARNTYNYCREKSTQSPRLRYEVEGESLMTLTQFKNKSKITVATASMKSVRGPHPDILSVDEGRELKAELWDAAKYMVVTSRAPLIIITTTPPDYPIGFVYDLYSKAQEMGYKVYNWKLIDVPYLSNEMRDDLERLRVARPQEYEREVLGKFSSMAGSVFDSQSVLDSRIDHQPQIVPIRTRIMGVDWGYNHPTAIVILQNADLGFYEVLFSDHFVYELYEKVQLILAEFVKRYRVDLCVADASNVGENQRLKATSRKPVEEVSFSQEKMNMITETRHLFEARRLKIPSNNTLLLDELMRYSWDIKSESMTPKVIKRDDDYVDALLLAVKGFVKPRWSLMTQPLTGDSLVSG